MAELLGPDAGVRLPTELADDEPAGVADEGWVDVLIAPLDLGDGRAMDAALVGEGGPADIRLVVVRVLVGDLGDRAAELREALEPSAAGRNERMRGLERKVGEDRQIG